MVKTPRPGQVKTRLIPAIGDEDAAGLAACFARDTVETARLAAEEVLVAYAPVDGKPDLERLLPEGLLWAEQPDSGLTERLEAAATHAVRLGFGPLLLIGTDSPTVPPHFLKMALDTLVADQADVVLGPTEDGGYYLIGFRGPVPGLLDEIAWSTPRVCEQTAANAERLGLRVRSLPMWYDVDLPEDLLRLRRELAESDEARLRAPATYRWLYAHDMRRHASG